MSALRTRWHKAKFDKPFFWITALLVAIGLLIFISASLSVLAEHPAQFYRMLMSQIVLGLCGGVVAGYIVFRVPLRFWQRYAWYFFIGAVAITCLVFIPGLAVQHGGATRWLDLGPISFQPAELLKLTCILTLSAWYAGVHKHIQHFSRGLVPFGIIVGIVGVVLLLQPDTDTFVVIALSGLVTYFVAGAKWRDIGILFATLLLGIGILLVTRPYVLSRFKTFLDPAHDPQGASYQVQQGFIAVGSGGFLGQGYGQSVQKFHYLPEAIGDSVFAVAGEEFGFVGSSVIIILYLLFAFRGFYIARRIPQIFPKLLVIGCTSLILIQSFMNIAAIIGVIPLTGLPLIFMSQGGTALLFSLLAVAAILNASQYMKEIPVNTVA